jgi:hypothetical protein
MRLSLDQIESDQDSISLRFDLLAKSQGGCAPQAYHGADYDIQLKCDGHVQAQRRVDGCSRNGHILRVSRLHDGKHTFQTRVRAVTDMKWSPWSAPMDVMLGDAEYNDNVSGHFLYEDSNDSLTSSLRSVKGMLVTSPGSVCLDSSVFDAGEEECLVVLQVSSKYPSFLL